MKNALCMTCHDKDKTQQYSKLNRIIMMCRNLETTDNRYDVDKYNARCKYSISCSDLTSWENKINQQLRKIATYMDSIVENEQIYRESLQLLRGEFPVTYRQLEKLNRQKNS